MRKTDILHLVLGIVAGVFAGLNILLLIFALGNQGLLDNLSSNAKQIKFFIVSSGSMEPAIPVGSAILVIPKKVYSPGDIITFKQNGDKKTIITHRVRASADGLYSTSGDANKDLDRGQVKGDDILGKVAISVPYLGYLINYVKLPYGFLLFIIIPATIVIYEELKSIKKEIWKILRFERKQPPGFEGNSYFKTFSMIPIIGAILVFIAFSGAFFSDNEQSLGNILSAAEEFPTGGIGGGLVINEVLPKAICGDRDEDEDNEEEEGEGGHDDEDEHEEEEHGGVGGIGHFGNNNYEDDEEEEDDRRGGRDEDEDDDKDNGKVGWIELFNNSGESVNLKDFGLSDGQHTLNQITSEDLIIPPGGFVLLSRSKRIWKNCYSAHGAPTVKISGKIKLSKEFLMLLNSEEDGIDTVAWGLGTGLEPAEGESLEREPDGFDTATGTNFEPSDFEIKDPPNPGS